MDNEQNNPEYWKLGLFYYNPQDKRLIIQKRIPGFGFTFNFGNPYSGLIIIAALVFIIAVAKTQK
jgi:uncharacterized membrane protein